MGMGFFHFRPRIAGKNSYGHEDFAEGRFGILVRALFPGTWRILSPDDCLLGFGTFPASVQEHPVGG